MVRRRIIEEASELFVRSGVKSTTMDDLAKHMGISKRTIYEHFMDKEVLLIACTDNFHEENKAFFEKVFQKADNVVDAIIILLRKGAEQASRRQFEMLNDIRKYYPQAYKEHMVRIHTDKRQSMKMLIRRGIGEGVFRDDLNPEIISYFFCRLAEGIALNDPEMEKFPMTEVFENLVITFLRGICISKGLKIIDRYRLETSGHP